MAITIEPGVYLEGFGGIRIEDTVVYITKTGCEVLTPTSKETARTVKNGFWMSDVGLNACSDCEIANNPKS
jgi:hypothetical protein